MGRGKRSVEEVEQKVDALCQITGGNPFTTKDLPDDIHRRLDYENRSGVLVLLERLANGTSCCGRQLKKVGRGEYMWINPSKMVSGELVKPASAHQVAKGMTTDEAVALDVIKEIMTKSQVGAIRLMPSMLAMNTDEFLDFMEKLESVKAMARIGTNGQSTGGYVWGLVRDKFGDFYQIAQAVRSGEYEFPREDPAPMAPEPTTPPPAANQKTTKVSTFEKLAAAMCKAAGEEIAESDKKIKSLEAELVQVREARVESVRRFNLFRQEPHKLQNK